MDKLKDSILKIANSDPNNPLSSSQISFLQHQIQLAFPDFLTPTHPTYAAMIHNAIKELNEEDGSTEESISIFIKENYEGLPWAHSTYLAHHLSKLCENGEIVWKSTSKCYTLSTWVGIEDGHLRKKQRKRRLVRKTKEVDDEDKDGSSCGEKVVEGNGALNEDIEEVGRNEDEEGKLSGENVVERSGNLNGYEEEDSDGIAGSRTKPRRRSLVFCEESDEFGTTAVDEGEQVLRAERLNEGLARGDGGGDASDDVKLMLVSNECAKESHVASVTPSLTDVKDDKDPELAVKESGLKGGDVPVQVEIQEGSSKKKQPERKSGRKRKVIVNEDEPGNSGEKEVMEVGKNLTGFQEEDLEESGNSMSKTKRRRLVVCENNDEGRETAIDGREQNLVTERLNEELSRGDEDNDTLDPAKMMLVPAECVEDSPVTLIGPSVSNVMGDINPKLAGKESGLKKSELMIVPYGRSTSMVNADLNSLSDAQGLLVCALPCISELERLERENSAKKRLKASKKRKTNISLELISSSSALVGVPNVLELNQKSSAHKFSPKKRLKSGKGKLEVSLKTMPSSPALAVDHNLCERNRLQELLSLRGFDSKASGVESEMGPAWLVPMLNARYFIPCPIHEGTARSGCKLFCIDCVGDAFCFKCLPHHKDHRVVQIRVSAGYYSVHVDDIQQHLDISSIQTYRYSNYSAKILFINHRSHMKPGKGSTCCENCCRSLNGSVRFCSLRCKLCIALSGATTFKKVPVDQSQQVCTPSLVKDASIEPISMVEEDLPLTKVLKKCTKRKKQVELKFTGGDIVTSCLLSKSQAGELISENSKQQIVYQQKQSQCDVGQLRFDVEAPMDTLIAVAPLAAEAPSLLGLKLQVDQPVLENYIQIEGGERQSQNHVQINDVEAPKDTSVEGLLASYEKCEPEPKQSQVDQPVSENSKQQIEDEERQSENDVRLDDAEEPTDTFVMGNVTTILQKSENDVRFDDAEEPTDTFVMGNVTTILQKFEQKPKQFQADQPFLDVSKQLIEDAGRQSQNAVDFDDVAAHMDTSVFGNEPTSIKKCEQEPKQYQIDQPISENSKQQLEDEEMQIQNNIEHDDVEAPMDTSVSVERNVLSSYSKVEQKTKQPEVGQPISESCKQQMEDIERQSQNEARPDDVEASMDKLVEGNVPTSDKKFEPEAKQSQVDQPISENSKHEEWKSPLDDIEADMDTSVEGNVPTSYTKCEQESKQPDATKGSVNLQCKKLNPRNDGRGRPRKKGEATKDVPSSSHLPIDQQEDLCNPEINQDSQQQIKPEKKKGRGRPPKHLKMAKNEAEVSSNLQLQKQAESKEPIEKLKRECRGRPKGRVTKEDSTVQLELAEKLEKEHRADLENSQSDAQEAVEGGQARSPSDDNIKETTESHNVDCADQSDQKQNVEECHEHEMKQGKLATKGYVRPPKENSAKNASIQVPLSSKDHLRSRIKNQSQNST